MVLPRTGIMLIIVAPSLRHLIETVARPRVTAGDTAKSEEPAPDQSVAFQGFVGVLGAGRDIPAGGGPADAKGLVEGDGPHGHPADRARSGRDVGGGHRFLVPLAAVI